MENMELMNADFFNNKKILITGATGFKGSWLAIWLLHLGAKVYGYSLKAQSPRDNFIKTGLERHLVHKEADVRNLDDLLSFFQQVQPDIAIHMAAQPLVLRSYREPVYTFETNLMGTVNFMEAVRLTPTVKAAINVTSDKCYENNEWLWSYRESDALGGKDPYSSSKGCSELISNSYSRSFFGTSETANIATVRAGNVIGGGDWADNRIIPDFFRSVENGTPLKIRNPNSVRPWQFVLEPLRGYLRLLEELFASFGKNKDYQGGWNFGPLDGNNLRVIDVADALISKYEAGSYEANCDSLLGKEATLLKLDISKAQYHLKWTPVLTFDETLNYTVEGYTVQNLPTEKIFNSRLQQIESYSKKVVK